MTHDGVVGEAVEPTFDTLMAQVMATAERFAAL